MAGAARSKCFEGPVLGQTGNIVSLVRRHYLDHNATTPLHPSARAAMLAAFDLAGNPSSIHAEGRAARAAVDSARREVAALVGTSIENVIFTSGGTEALNMALMPAVASCDRLLMSAGEHPAVLAGHRFGERSEIVPLLSDGMVDLAALERQVAGRPVVLALQAANNETGVIHPVAEAAAIVHAAGGIAVCDAVQAAGKISCDFRHFGVDALAISAHKFGGPKGIGALCFALGHPHLGNPVVRGGGQEQGLRAGTENIAGIAGLGAACASAERRRLDGSARLSAWRDTLQAKVIDALPGVIVFGDRAARLPNTLIFAASGFDAQVLLMKLDLDGIAVSAGSACAAGKVKPSHVLSAMGVPDALATSAIRISLGWTTEQDDIDAFAEAFARAVRTMRSRIAA